MADKNFNQDNQSRHQGQDWERERNRSNQEDDWSSQRYGNAGYGNRQDEDQNTHNRVNYLPDNDENRDRYNRNNEHGGYGNSGYSGSGMQNDQRGYGGENRGAYNNTGYGAMNSGWDQQRNSRGSYGNSGNNDWTHRNQQQSGQWGNDYGQQDWNRRNMNSGYNNQWNNDRPGSGYSGMQHDHNREQDRNRYSNTNRDRNDNDWWDRNRGRTSNMDTDNRESRNDTNTHRGKGPANYRRSEDRIREDICDRLTDDDRVDASGIHIQIESDVVILSGTVNSRDEKRRAEDLVESVSGVRNVENRLRVGGNVLATHEYTGNTDNAGGIGNESGTTNEIIRDVRNEKEGDTRKGRTKNT